MPDHEPTRTGMYEQHIANIRAQRLGLPINDEPTPYELDQRGLPTERLDGNRDESRCAAEGL